MNRFITGGLTLKENLIILLVCIIPTLIAFHYWRNTFQPKPVEAVVVTDTFVEKCTAHGGCLFIDQIPEGMCNFTR